MVATKAVPRRILGSFSEPTIVLLANHLLIAGEPHNVYFPGSSSPNVPISTSSYRVFVDSQVDSFADDGLAHMRTKSSTRDEDRRSAQRCEVGLSACGTHQERHTQRRGIQGRNTTTKWSHYSCEMVCQSIPINRRMVLSGV